jgi:hypothetical protein
MVLLDTAGGPLLPPQMSTGPVNHSEQMKSSSNLIVHLHMLRFVSLFAVELGGNFNKQQCFSPSDRAVHSNGDQLGY